MRLRIYVPEAARFLTAPGLGQQGNLKKGKVSLDVLTDLICYQWQKKGIREGICHAILQYSKTNNKYMKDYDKKSLYLKYWDVNDFMVRDVTKIA